jgi:hypothetical protein
VSFKVTQRVWSESKATGNALLLMLALADYADETGRCWPSSSQLLERTRLTYEELRTATFAIAGLGECDIDIGGGRAVYQLKLGGLG